MYKWIFQNIAWVYMTPSVFPPNKELTKNLDTQPYDQFLKVGFFHIKSGLSKLCRSLNTLSLANLKVNVINFVGLWRRKGRGPGEKV